MNTHAALPAVARPLAARSWLDVARARAFILAAIVGASLLVLALLAQAQPASDLDVRLKKLEEELRCLVCQNQTLADSDAALAQDLRREVRGLAEQGKSDEEIKSYLVARYGDFVLYRPPVKPTTWLLWLGPFLLLGVGGFAWWRMSRRRPATPAEQAPDEPLPSSSARAVERARMLLDEPPAS